MIKINYYVYLYGEWEPIVCCRYATGATPQHVAMMVCGMTREHGRLRGVDGARLTHIVQAQDGECSARSDKNYIFDAHATQMERTSYEERIAEEIKSVMGDATVQRAMKDQPTCA